ncbi:MAG TPA: hypothetical protein VGM56_30880 [Byssovorax sp.]|jgi:hypothetical protein
MSRGGTRATWLGAVTLAASACVGAPLHTSAPAAQGDAFVRALEIEQRKGPKAALDAYVSLVEDGANDPSGLAEVSAGLDAIIEGPAIAGIDRLGEARGLVDQVAGARPDVVERLTGAYDHAAGSPIARVLIARALEVCALRAGDAGDAAKWRKRSGVPERATIVGPLTTAAVAGVLRPTPLEGAGALAASYPGVAPFFADVTPVVASARGASFALDEANGARGLYAVVVDVTLPRAGRVFVAMRSHAPAVVVAGGAEVAVRGPELAEGTLMSLGAVDLPEGRSRVVVRAAKTAREYVSVFLLDARGEPLETRAPVAGDDAPGRAAHAAPIDLGGASTPPVLAAAGLLGVGDKRRARSRAEGAGASPAAALIEARALEGSSDVPLVHRRAAERLAYDRVAATWPDAWEPAVGRVMLDFARRGRDGAMTALDELAKQRAAHEGASPIPRALEGSIASEQHMVDVAASAIADVGRAGPSTMAVELDRRAGRRVGRDAARFACEAEGRDRVATSCLAALHTLRDGPAFAAELARLRALASSPTWHVADEVDEAIAEGHVDAALALYDAAPPAERSLAWLSAALDRPAVVRARIERDAARAADAPGGLQGLLTLVGDDARFAEMERRGAAAVARDHAAPSAAGAAVVLLHDERYTLEKSGLLSYTIHDVRKFNGTADVDRGAASIGPTVAARDTQRTLRRRVHKKDGRVVEPERLAARQANADVSQLEPGDVVEQIVAGFAVPSAYASQLLVDGADLMPERTAVASASVEVTWPTAVPLARWAHPLLGAAKERREGDHTVARWELAGAAPRRSESRTPRGERAVAVVFGTFDWPTIGSILAEDVARHDDADPVVARWARAAAGDARGRAAVDRVTAAAGRAVTTSTWTLDSARVALETGRGTRAMLIRRALREIGVASDLLFAEAEPYASSASYPAHPGRFAKPVVLAHLPNEQGGDVWIEADVAGPPLPPGRVSAELRGREAITASGERLVVRADAQADDVDKIDLALQLDERGDATGTATLALSGRDAQGLAQRLDKAAGYDRVYALRAVVLSWFPWAAVDDVALASPEGTWPLVVKATVRVTGYAEVEKGALVLPGFAAVHRIGAAPTTLGHLYAGLLGRTSTLSIASAVRYALHRRVQLPARTKLARGPVDVTISNTRLHARRAAKLEGGALDEAIALDVTTGNVGSGEYERFAEDVRRTDEGFEESVRLLVGAK